LSSTQRPWPGLDQLGAIQAGGGLSIGLIALFFPMTTSPPSAAASVSSSNGESFSSLPRWRQWLSMLNWRRDPGYEQRKMRSEWRMKQIESETEQLRRENARLRQLNAKGRALLSCIDQHCFPPESSSIPPQPTEPDCGPSSP
jgi:hypothetical protein